MGILFEHRTGFEREPKAVGFLFEQVGKLIEQICNDFRVKSAIDTCFEIKIMSISLQIAAIMQ